MRRLPGVGAKSAQRMAYHLLQHDRGGARVLAAALQAAASGVHHCALPHLHRRRTVRRLPRPGTRCGCCVVETPADQAALERTGSYRGLYLC